MEKARNQEAQVAQSQLPRVCDHCVCDHCEPLSLYMEDKIEIGLPRDLKVICKVANQEPYLKIRQFDIKPRLLLSLKKKKK